MHDRYGRHLWPSTWHQIKTVAELAESWHAVWHSPQVGRYDLCSLTRRESLQEQTTIVEASKSEALWTVSSYKCVKPPLSAKEELTSRDCTESSIGQTNDIFRDCFWWEAWLPSEKKKPRFSAWKPRQTKQRGKQYPEKSLKSLVDTCAVGGASRYIDTVLVDMSCIFLDIRPGFCKASIVRLNRQPDVSWFPRFLLFAEWLRALFCWSTRQFVGPRFHSIFDLSGLPMHPFVRSAANTPDKSTWSLL